MLLKLTLESTPSVSRANKIGFGFNLARIDTPLNTAVDLFGFEKDETIIFFPMNWRWEDVAVECGLWDSKSEAKRNGFSGVIPTGFNERKLKKIRQVIYTYVPPNTGD